MSTLMDRPEDEEKKLRETASIKVPTLRTLTIDELLDMRNNLLERSDNTDAIDKELTKRFS